MRMRKSYCFLLIFVLCGYSSAQGLDLSDFQAFLKSKTGAATKKAKESSVRALSDNADAQYKQNQLVTLQTDNKQDSGDSLRLPAETRIPEGLRPLLSDRKTPRQGIGLSGNTGALLVPSPGVLEPGKSAVVVHAIPFDLYSVNDVKYEDESYFDTQAGLVYGVTEGLELGIDKVFTNQDRFDITEPTYINMKYQVPGNITLGANWCTDSQSAYSSAWVGAGVPVAWIGVGANFGATNYKFSYNGWDKLKRAKYGGYNYRYDRAEGYADPVFFIVGGAIPMSNYTHFVYDFNGDKFSLGFRFNYQKTIYFDASFVSDGDYERLPGAIAHKRLQNFIFGGSIVY